MPFLVATPGDGQDSDSPQPAVMMGRFVPAGAAIPFTGQSCNGICIVLKDLGSLDSVGLGVEFLKLLQSPTSHDSHWLLRVVGLTTDSGLFQKQGFFRKEGIEALVPLLDELKAFKAVRVESAVLSRLESLLQEKQLADLSRSVPHPVVKLKARLYPYQEEGVRFGLFKRAALIGVEFTREKRTELLNQLRGMLAEEPLPPPASAVPSEEIPEDTPHYLNPEALKSADDRTVDVTVEENAVAAQPEAPETALETVSRGGVGPERMEEVLNSGMAFIGGLLEMVTGRKLETSAADGRMLHVDRQSGEVTLKFKLPGFESNAPT